VQQSHPRGALSILALRASTTRILPGQRALLLSRHTPAHNSDGGSRLSVVFFQDSGKFTYRYSTLGFQDEANLDDGDMWPVSYALMKWSPVVEKKIVELVKAAIP
jgi:hypothetical protein